MNSHNTAERILSNDGSDSTFVCTCGNVSESVFDHFQHLGLIPA